MLTKNLRILSVVSVVVIIVICVVAVIEDGGRNIVAEGRGAQSIIEIIHGWLFCALR